MLKIKNYEIHYIALCYLTEPQRYLTVEITHRTIMVHLLRYFTLYYVTLNYIMLRLLLLFFSNFFYCC